jgi:3-isopropylmalate/(R)-2-methylmalate dehydratase small subunit
LGKKLWLWQLSRVCADRARSGWRREAVIAESYARIFFRNSVATGELYPYESGQRLIDRCKTGDTATIDFDSDTLELNGEVFPLKPMGDVRPVIEAGGLFNYARRTGMISK